MPIKADAGKAEAGDVAVDVGGEGNRAAPMSAGEEGCLGFDRGVGIARAETPHGKGVTVRREGKKVGRNDPCPCGSGKKYKRCCLPKEEARA